MVCRITVLGIVQGIGYRPFAARLAEELSISGTVKNSSGIVVILASGTQEAVEEFIHRLQFQCPKGGQVLEVRKDILSGSDAGDEFKTGVFSIAESDSGSCSELPLVPPDLGVCDDCLREMADDNDRRYRHALISCISCGPRFSILNGLPYDRNQTVMDDYMMCPSCQGEYTGRGRRRHAQTISCHDCGPQLVYKNMKTGKRNQQEQAFSAAVEALREGGIIAVKGIGGFQLVCLPDTSETVICLRRIKDRGHKPFAVMFHDIVQIEKSCAVSKEEEQALCSPARPIVLLEKKKECFIQEVSSDVHYLGAFLPNAPLQSLLTEALGPLIITSCNRSGEMMMTEEKEIYSWNCPELCGILSHSRRILTPLDDSVGRVFHDSLQLIRRSRGYVPMPLFLRTFMPAPLLSMGGDLKSCFGLASENRVYLSQYFGDLESMGIRTAYETALERMEQIFGIMPVAAVCDLHPGYHTVRLAQRLREQGHITRIIAVQHHHAHIASVMAEHGLKSCIGIAFDGTGYGTDGAVWGSEFLYCRNAHMKRMGHLDYTWFCGGDTTALDGGMALMCYLAELGGQSGDERFPIVKAALEHRINTVASSSMGRLFDAVSAALDICEVNSYEGECAAALEQAAYEAQKNGELPYPLGFQVKKQECGDDQAIFTASGSSVIKEITEAFHTKGTQPRFPGGTSKGALALGFHHAVADFICQLCINIKALTGEHRAALSGGVFANRLLSELCRQKLSDAGFELYWNEAVPCNDSGLALGQAWLASNMEDEES